MSSILLISYHPFHTYSPLNQNPQILFQPEGRPLSLKMKRLVAKKLQELLATHPSLDLYSLGTELLKLLSSANLVLISPHPSLLVVKTIPLKETMRTSFLKGYAISESGRIFRSSSAENLPLFHIPMQESDLHSLGAATYQPKNPEDAAIIKEANQLLTLLEQQNIPIKTIHFDRHLGFEVTTRSLTKISLGRAPFQIKMERLQRAMHMSLKNGMEVERIELDYTGKAFIKEKVL